LPKIIQTIVAFSNTAGGCIAVGIKDKTKKVIGMAHVLQEEERIASAIADSISPLLIPSLQLYTWNGNNHITL
jgi:ATP-dependent DNA helicase RecG